jgi:ribonuclease HI
MLSAMKKLPKLSRTVSGSKKDAKIYPSSEYVLNFDGASKGNPGLSGAGMVIYKNGLEIWSSCKFIGYKTNNQAEYSGLIFGLKGALDLKITNLSVLGDSLLVINQVTGLYKVKSDSLLELHKEVLDLKSQFNFIEFNHVYRENNKRADELSNLALENIGDLSQTQSESDKMTKELADLGIQDLQEDWIEDCSVEDAKKYKTDSKAKVKKETRLGGKNSKQSDITQFFKVNSLFPDI